MKLAVFFYYFLQASLPQDVVACSSLFIAADPADIY